MSAPASFSVSPRPVADDLGDIGAAVSWAEEVLAAAGVEPDQRGDVQVCLEEHLANLITHGRAGSAGKDISVLIEVRPEAVEATVSDRTHPFDPLSASLTAWSQERGEGNGLRLIRGFASELRYLPGPPVNRFALIFARRLPAADALRTVPAFAHLPAAALARLAMSATARDVPAGTRLIVQGDPSEHAFALLEGELDAIDESSHGASAVGRVTAPALVGEIGALAGLPRTATLVAAAPVKILEIPSEALLSAAKVEPGLLTTVIASLGQQILNLNHAIGLYTKGLSALEKGELDIPLLAELQHPSPELAAFRHSLEQLARRITDERQARGSAS